MAEEYKPEWHLVPNHRLSFLGPVYRMTHSTSRPVGYMCSIKINNTCVYDAMLGSRDKTATDAIDWLFQKGGFEIVWSRHHPNKQFNHANIPSTEGRDLIESLRHAVDWMSKEYGPTQLIFEAMKPNAMEDIVKEAERQSGVKMENIYDITCMCQLSPDKTLFFMEDKDGNLDKQGFIEDKGATGDVEGVVNFEGFLEVTNDIAKDEKDDDANEENENGHESDGNEGILIVKEEEVNPNGSKKRKNKKSKRKKRALRRKKRQIKQRNKNKQ